MARENRKALASGRGSYFKERTQAQPGSSKSERVKEENKRHSGASTLVSELTTKKKRSGMKPPLKAPRQINEGVSYEKKSCPAKTTRAEPEASGEGTLPLS